MSPSLEIMTEAPGWEAFDWLPAATKSAIDASLAAAGVVTVPDAEISLLLCDDARIRELNALWRSQDKATNVLSFPAVEPDEIEQAPLLGDIAVALETVTREADAERKSFQDHYVHLVVHGLLHLLGYDHEADEEAEEMEDLERRIMSDLGISDPYGDVTREQRRP